MKGPHKMSTSNLSTAMRRYLLHGYTREAVQVLASAPAADVPELARDLVMADVSSSAANSVMLYKGSVEPYAESVWQVLEACKRPASADKIIRAAMYMLALGDAAGVKRGRFGDLVEHAVRHETVPPVQQPLKEALLLGRRLPLWKAHSIVNTMAPGMLSFDLKGIISEMPYAVVLAAAVFVWCDVMPDPKLFVRDRTRHMLVRLIEAGKTPAVLSAMAPPVETRENMPRFFKETYMDALVRHLQM